MQQRKHGSAPASGRPSGTDGYDFSYRMVVDSRYTMVALGKSRLSTLFLLQAFVLLIRVLCTCLPLLKEETLNVVAVLSPLVGLLSLIVGESGRRRSNTCLLKACMVVSSIGLLLWAVSIDKEVYSLKAFQDLIDWKLKKLEIVEIGHLFLGVLVHICALSTTNSLIRNMRPPKKSS